MDPYGAGYGSGYPCQEPNALDYVYLPPIYSFIRKSFALENREMKANPEWKSKKKGILDLFFSARCDI